MIAMGSAGWSPGCSGIPMRLGNRPSGAIKSPHSAMILTRRWIVWNGFFRASHELVRKKEPLDIKTGMGLPLLSELTTLRSG